MDNTENYQIRKNYIEEKIEYYSNNYTGDRDEGFMLLSSSLILEFEPEDLDPSIIVDGGEDKQIDIIRIEEKEDEYVVIDIIQSKNADGFSPTVLVNIQNGLKWIFEASKDDYSRLSNKDLINKIQEIRELRLEYGNSNIYLNVYYATKGNTQRLADEYIREKEQLLGKYESMGFAQFKFKDVGAIELIDYVEEIEQFNKQIDIRVPIIYDVNRPSVLQMSIGDTNAIICTIRGTELARIARLEPRDAIFDLNVRPFYGIKGKVNNEIYSSCTGNDSYRFWFLNNGITMVCDEFELIPDPDQTEVKVTNAQIVNGCQTSVSIREAFESGELKEDVKILLKIYSTDNPNLADKITLTTNNQNKITSRDLRANDKVQRDIQRFLAESYGWYYERKNKQYSHFRGSKRKKVIPNVKAAQAYLAIVRRKPSKSKGSSDPLWSDFYNEIFSNATIEDLLGSFLIFKFCNDKSKSSRKEDISIEEKEVRVYGIYQICRLVGFYLLEDKWGSNNKGNVLKLVDKLQSEEIPSDIEEFYNKAVKEILKIRERDMETEYSTPALYFKASLVQNNLERRIAELKAV